MENTVVDDLMEKKTKISAKPEDIASFKYKGNKIQFDFNLKLVEDLKNAIEPIEDGSIRKSIKM